MRSLSPAVAVPAVAGVVATILGQVLPWGVIGDAQGVPVWLRILAVVAALFAVALVVPARDGFGDSALRGGGAVLFGGGTLVGVVTQLDAQIVAHVGGWFAIVGAGAIGFAGVLALVAAFVSTPLLARGTTGIGVAVAVGVLVVVTAVVGGLLWPAYDIESSTARALTPTSSPAAGRVLWTASARNGPVYPQDYLGVFGGRPVISFVRDVGNGNRAGTKVVCTAGARGLDPRTGHVAWTYSRPAECGKREGLEADAGATIVRLRYVTRHVAPPTIVYLDPATGKVLHPAHADDDVTTWAGHFGVIGAGAAGVNQRVRLVEARTGRPVASAAPPTCSGPGGSRVPTTDVNGRSQASVTATKDAIAIPYLCEQNSGTSVRMLVITRSGGHLVSMPNLRGDHPTSVPAVSGELVALRYQSQRAQPGRSSTGYRDVMVGVDTVNGRVAWTTYLPFANSAVAAAGTRFVTSGLVIDAATGTTRRTSGSTVRVNDPGVAVGGDWFSVAAAAGQVSVLRVDTSTGRAKTTELPQSAAGPELDGDLATGVTAAGLVAASDVGPALIALGS